MCARQRGMSLIELIVAIVIISVGVSGVMLAFNTTVRDSAEPMIRKQLLAVAEGMLEEILLQPYVAASGTITGCDRQAADDIFDYNGYSQGICDIGGNAVATLSGYTVEVTVTSPASLGNLAASADVARVMVTAVHGADRLMLTGYRTKYAN